MSLTPSQRSKPINKLLGLIESRTGNIFIRKKSQLRKQCLKKSIGFAQSFVESTTDQGGLRLFRCAVAVQKEASNSSLSSSEHDVSEHVFALLLARQSVEVVATSRRLVCAWKLFYLVKYK